MAYDKQVWYDNQSGGTPITAARLNHMEDGIEDAAVRSHAASDITSGTLPIARGGTGGATAAAARTSLDAMQREVALYSGKAGGNLTLSETAANFTALRIVTSMNDDVYASTVYLPSPNGKTFDVSASVTTSYGLGAMRARWSVSGTSLTVGANGKIYVTVDGVVTYSNVADDKLYIRKVYGIR